MLPNKIFDKMPYIKSPHAIKVLYIAGFERSGSTILNRVLGQIENFVAWGELRDIWEHGKIENRFCTCGAPYLNCKAWSNILDAEFDNGLGLTPYHMLQLKRRTRATVLLKSLGPWGNSVFQRASTKYAIELDSLYTSIQNKTNSQVIVDSTKASWYGSVLSELPNIDLYTVHVVRDPRGVYYSLQRRKEQGDSACQWYSPLHAFLSWSLKNVGVEFPLNISSQRYLRVRYEDFIAFSEASVKKVLKLIGESQSKLPFVRKSTVKMGLDHIITGSPSSCFDTGEVELRNDDKWKQDLSAKDEALVSTLTLPLLKKYGYPYKD
jgi:hypothetical protein